MKRVILESPYSGEVQENIKYARECVKDCLKRGEAPIASHLLYTQEGVLDDLIPSERKLGIEAGHSWLTACDSMVVYIDRGITLGMESGIKQAQDLSIPVEYRSLSSS